MNWRPGLSWVGIIVPLLIAGLFWSMDTDALLRSLTPDLPAWIALAILWFEISLLILVFVRRYRMKQSSLTLCLLIAWACAGLNVILTIPLLPALALGI